MVQHLVWSEEFSVGSEDIDSQHQKLISLINWLSTEVTHKTPGTIEHLLNSLAHYTVYHFGYEEELFRKAGYPDAKQHQQEHTAFIDRILVIRERFEQGSEVDLEALAVYLQQWVVRHICISDQKMMAWLRNNACNEARGA